MIKPDKATTPSITKIEKRIKTTESNNIKELEKITRE